MKIDDITLVSSPYHGLWTTIWFHIDSDNDVVGSSKLIMSELQLRHKTFPSHVSENEIALSIRKMFQITGLSSITEVNFQLDYTERDQRLNVGVDWNQIPKENHALFNVMADSSNNLYKEILMSNNEKIRVTKIQDSWNGDNALRIQIRQEDGHLRQGPEIPVEYLEALIKELNTVKTL